MSNRRVLKNYIKQILKEEDGGGDFGGYGDYGGGFGGASSKWGYGDWSHVKKLYDIFADPFKVASSEIQKVIPNVKAMLQVLFESIMTTIVPFLSDDYDKIFKARDEKIKAVEQKYGEVYNRLWSSFTGGGAEDLLILGFMMNPGLFMAGAAFWKVPERAIAGTQMLSGGTGGEAVQTIAQLGSDAVRFVLGDKSSIAKPYKRFESVESIYNDVLLEKKQSSVVQDYASAIKNFKNSGEMDEVLKSRHAQDASSIAEKIVSDNLNDVIESAKKMSLKVDSLEDIKKMLGGDAQEELEQIDQIGDENRRQFEDQLVKSTQRNIRAWYAGKLAEELKNAQSSGLPSGTKIESMYKKAISALS